MAKTLTVNITPILKKESRKRKKNKKKIHFSVFFQKSLFHSLENGVQSGKYRKKKHRKNVFPAHTR